MATLRSAKQTTGQPKRSRFLTSLATSAIMLASLLGVSAAYPQATAQAVTCVSADRNVTGIENLTATPPEYATIGAAVTAASPGEQICIGAGTWPEQVTISKELTLTGAGEAVTTISSPASLVAVCGTDLANYANSVAIVDICGAVANVTISDLTIDGDWDGAGPLSGMPASGRSEFFGLVVHGGATATISNLTVTNINQANSGSWGAQQGRAVWVGPASTLSATNIHVLRYQKSGIFASGGSGALGAVATLNLSDSLVEGDQLAGMNSAIAMNGITIIGADATLHGVTSRGNQCDVASCGFTGFTSGGLLIYDRAGVVPAMHVYISASIFQDNDWGVYTRVRKIDSSVEVNGNDISLNRYVGLEVNEGNATFLNNDITDNGIVGIELTSGIEGVAPVQATFVRNLIKGNGGVHAASSGIRLVENPGYASRASLLFSSNAIIDNAGVTVAHLSYSGATLSTDDVITGTGTWWGDSVQPGDASMNFTSNLATLSDALATDSSDASYGFIVSSVAIESSVDLPPLTIASSDRAAMPTPISIDFGAISGGGTVTAVLSEQPAEGNISFGTNPSVVDIDFTGTFTGSVEICIGYDPAQYYAGSSILLFHFIGGTWVDVTSSVDESTRRVCGLVSSFSPFAAGEELAVYAITYDANDGTLAGGEDPSYTYGDAAITAPSDPTRTGYDFAGWFRDDITFATSAFPLTPTGDTTVYAKWDLIEDDADLIAPITTAPVVSISLGSQVGSSAPLNLEWTGADNVGGSGIASYDVEASRNSGQTWVVVASSLGDPFFSLNAPATGALIYRVRARDVAGNVGDWVLGQKISPQLLRETDRAARYRGFWARLRGAQYTNNAATSAQRRRDAITLTTTSRSLGILASTGPSAGIMQISVNGTLVATVDLWAPTATARQVVWQASWETAVRRTVLLVVAQASRTVHVEIDGFVTLR